MRRALLLQAITFLMLLVALLVLGSQMIKTRRLARDGRQAHDSLCVLKHNLKVRVDDGRAFLDSHPRGIPGISPADIQRSITNQQASLDSLSSLTCPEPKQAGS